MKRLSAVLVVLLAVPSFAAEPAPKPAADLVLTNARVWTVNTAQPEAEALAVWHGRILAVGTNAEVKPLIGPGTRVLDAEGRRVLPGLYDSHAHLLGGGMRLGEVALKDAKDEAEFGRRIREFDQKLPRDRWLVGGEWDHDRTFDGQLPTAEMLDKYVHDRPALLRRYDGHMALANTAALKLAGITAETSDPPGGVIYRKPGTRQPTGLLRDNAMSLVDQHVPPPSDDEIAEGVRAALAEARSVGVTSIQDMDGSDAVTRRKLFRLYQRLAKQGELTCRIDLRWPLAAWEELAKLGAEAGLGDDWVRVGGLKGFIDGSLGSSTAKMFEPYVNEPGSTGVYVTPPERLRDYITGADKAGLSVAVHAIGDRGNADILDVFADVIKANGPRDRRFRVEHAQHLRPQDFARFKELGVVASMQPYHIVDDGRWAEGRIGAKRCASSYANRSLLDAGAKVAFGSDWSVAPMSPILGIDAAVNRRTLDDKNPEGWFPEQKITAAEAVEAYTLTAAYAAFQEKDRGSLEPGKLGDFVILSRDVLDPKERDHIAEAEVLVTVVGGKVVYDRKARADKESPAKEEWKPAPVPLVTKWAKDVNPERVHPEYPRPQMVRKEWLNLNGLWQLAFAKEKEDPPLGHDLPEKILVPFPVESSLSGVGKHVERLWYRRTFTVPKDWGDKRVLLHFGAVDWEATVWVNGQKLGEHRGGYDGFSFDVTEHLKKDGDNELVVGVWDPTDRGYQPRGKQVLKPEGIYYTPSTGIWQTVWLEPVSEVSIEALKVIPDPKKFAPGNGKVPESNDRDILVQVKLRGDVKKGFSLRGVIRDGGSDQGKATNDLLEKDQSLLLSVGHPKLWSPESPTLYDIDVQLVGPDGKVVDQVSSYWGFRTIEVGKDDKGVTRLLLNGKPYFMVGPLDQGFWPEGIHTAPTDEALKYDIEVTKKLGFNMTRKHVKVEPDRWYYWCDKLGLLVWQDMPSGERSINPNQPDITRSEGSAKQYEQELKALIDGRQNHPCIVMWMVFNEGWGQFDTPRITKWTKEYDPTRLVNCASGWADRGVGDVHDIHVYPGPGAPKPEEKRAAVLGEFGGLGLETRGHIWGDKIWGYAHASNPEELTRKYERLLARVYELKDDPGLSAAVYTQITDVETEGNGLMTYDRAMIKPDAERVAAVNRGDLSKVIQFRTVVPTAREKKDIAWHYTFERPADNWFANDFDDKEWKQGPSGFGTRGTPRAIIGTEWKTDDIWIRREFELPEEKYTSLHLVIHHDEDAEVYVNGVLAAKLSGYITDYEEVPISEEALKTMKPGKNRFAVHCHQTGGGQYIDVGIEDVKPAKK